ncbi:MAG: hypothetical protein QM664_07875 [Flavihumibacter sp.]
MLAIQIPNRPFSTELITGMMMPDGIFESSLGKQRINVHFVNTGASLNQVNLYFESASHPAISVTPETYTIGLFGAGATVLRAWDIDVSGVPAGTYYVSFLADAAAGAQRIVKKIFVTNIAFDPSTHLFTAATPEGIYSVRYREISEVQSGKCCSKKGNQRGDEKSNAYYFEHLAQTFALGAKKIELCPVIFLPLQLETGWTPTPPYDGQYSDLPFNDPWWKILLAIIAALLVVAAGIAEAAGGTGSVGTTVGCPESPIGVCADGGGTSYVAAGLVAAAAAVATVAVFSDERDVHRIGQDRTPPGAGEKTVSESLHSSLNYLESITPGKPFKVGIKWAFTRTTVDGSGNTHTYTASDQVVQQNTHLLSRYEVSAPDIVRIYKKQAFEVKASFYDENEKLLVGNQLFVKCFLVHTSGKVIELILEDNGLTPDVTANDGIYAAKRYFSRDEVGRWKFLVIAQDVNHAKENMDPEEAAQIIGGMLLTSQLSISFSGGTCSLVPDGDVEVIA